MNSGRHQQLREGTEEGGCLQKRLRKNNQRSRIGREYGQRIYEQSFKCSKWRKRSLLSHAQRCQNKKEKVYPLDLSGSPFGDLD